MGWKVYPHHPLQTCQVRLLCNSLKFKTGSLSWSYTEGHIENSAAVSSDKPDTWKQLIFSSRGESGQWKYDKQWHKQQVPLTWCMTCLTAPPPCPVTLEYFSSSSTAASGWAAVLVSPPTSFFWPWRVSGPWIRITLSTLSCDIRAVFLLLSSVFGNY